MSYLSLLNTIGAGYIALIAIGGVLVLAITLTFCIVPMKAWFTALFSGVYVQMGKLASLKLRKIKAMDIVRPYIAA
ncbi:MAG: hypothetical protein NC218_12330, partial [Acetobacter sp.]|nr:hypothetical protein [Acetobacter sp.]